MKIWLSKVVVAATLAFVSPNASAMSSCGSWDTILDRESFSAQPFGTLALVQRSQHFVFGRNRCVNLNEPPRSLTFNISHSEAIGDRPTFLSVHVALISVSPAADRQYLYRNGSYWRNDKSGARYRSSHDLPHPEFNRALSGDRNTFDSVFMDRESGRVWTDAVETRTQPPTHYDSWTNRSTFEVRNELLNAVKQGTIGVKTQNYLISFASRKATAGAGAPPDFQVGVGGYDCALIRIGATAEFGDADGEYMLNFRQNQVCDTIVSGFSGKSFWAFLFRL